MKTQQKIKLVVLNENVLGYIKPSTPEQVNILHASILKGAIHIGRLQNNTRISKNCKVRLASKEDFKDFRVCFDGYDNGEYEYFERPTP